MLHGTNMPRKDNPRWIISNAVETIRIPGGRHRPAFGMLATVGTRYGRFVAWLIGLPRRAGRRLFAMNDAEAGWHHWQLTELRGGFARGYRDPRFDLLRTMRAAAPPDPDPGTGASSS